MREGFAQEDNKVDEKRRRRGSEEVIDQDEAPQVIIDEKFKDKIAEEEARAYVVEKEGAKIGKPKENDSTKANVINKPKPENVSVGMKKAKKLSGVKRIVEDDKDSANVPEKSRKSASRKEKRLKLSFEEDE